MTPDETDPGEDVEMGTPEAMRPVLADLERGVRLEVLVAPLVVGLPLLTAAVLVRMGLDHGSWRLVVLGSIVGVGNLVFDALMARGLWRFFRSVREGIAPGTD